MMMKLLGNQLQVLSFWGCLVPRTPTAFEVASKLPQTVEQIQCCRSQRFDCGGGVSLAGLQGSYRAKSPQSVSVIVSESWSPTCQKIQRCHPGQVGLEDLL